MSDQTIAENSSTNSPASTTLTALTTDALVSLTSYQRGQLAHYFLCPPILSDPEEEPSTTASASTPPENATATNSTTTEQPSDAKNPIHETKESQKVNLLSPGNARMILSHQIARMRHEEATTVAATSSSHPQKERPDVRKAVLGKRSPSTSKHRSGTDGRSHAKRAGFSSTKARLQHQHSRSLQEVKRIEGHIKSLELQLKSYRRIEGGSAVVSRLEAKIAAAQPALERARAEVQRIIQASLAEEQKIMASKATTTEAETQPQKQRRLDQPQKQRLDPPPPLAKRLVKPHALPTTKQPKQQNHPPPKQKAKARLVEGLLASAQQQDNDRSSAVTRYGQACADYSQHQVALAAAEKDLMDCLQNQKSRAREIPSVHAHVQQLKATVAQALQEKEAAESVLQKLMMGGG